MSNPKSSPKQKAAEFWATTKRTEGSCDWCACTVKKDDGFIVHGPVYTIGNGPMARKIDSGDYLLCDACFLKTNGGTKWQR